MFSSESNERALQEPVNNTTNMNINNDDSTPHERREEDTEEVTALVEERMRWWERIVTPRVVLAIFTAVNFITYYDRGAIAGCLAVIKEDGSISGDARTLSDTKSGFIISGFMIGFMTTSPLFAALGGTVPSKWIIVGGMLAWAISCIGTAFAKSYIFLLICRIVVGIGEAAFVGFTVTVIDAIAPRETRTLWIGTFYSMIPVGTAVGMALGGIISSNGVIASIEGWRVVFITEVIAAIPIVILVACLPNKYNMRQNSEGTKYVPLHKATIMLIKNINYVLILFGYAMYCFVVGAVSVWAIPMLVQGPMRLSNLTASVIMGGVTAITGVFGSLAGGIVVDKLGGSRDNKGTMNCQLFNAIMVLICVPLGILALFMKTLWLFITILVISVFALFAVTAPVNAAILTVVPPDLKAYAISYSVFIIHALGDFPSPTFAGFLSDRFFSKGCPNHDYDLCVDDNLNQCVWVNGTSKDSDGHCVNEYQLRNSLLVVFSILAFAIPSWLAVYFRLRQKLRSSSESTTVTNDSSYLSERREYRGVSLSSSDGGFKTSPSVQTTA